MRTRTVVYKDDDYDVELEVCQVSLVQGFRRIALHSRELARLKERGQEADLMVQWVAIRSLPDCLACTNIKNLSKDKKQLPTELSLDEFLALPEALVIVWEQAVYECNPHWLPQRKEPEQGEAQEPADSSNSTSGSSSGSSEKNQKKSQNGTSTT